jgi:hypothetical protein
MKLIQTQTLTTAAASIEFASIPQDGTDLVLKMSLRGSGTFGDLQVANFFNFNGSTAAQTSRYLIGTGTSAPSFNYTELYGWVNSSGSTSNTFNNAELYIPNYAGSTNKSASIDGVVENNASATWLFAGTLLWANTAAITNVSISAGSLNFVAGSTISLYKITKGSDGITTAS